MSIARNRGYHRAAKRDHFDHLFTTHFRSVLAYLVRRTRPETAADVLSETFLVAWRKMEEVPLGDEARPWLFKTARFVLMNRRRSVRSYSRTLDRLAVEVRHQLVELGHEDLLTTDHAVRDALNRLPFLEREVLVLTIWDELKPGEIAEVLELPGAAVRKHLFRARSAMRTMLAGVLDEASSEIPKNTEQSRPSRHVHSEPFNPTPKRR